MIDTINLLLLELSARKAAEGMLHILFKVARLTRQCGWESHGVVLVPSHEPKVVSSPRPPAVGETPLVDRAEEMKLLKEAVDRAVRGEGGLVFLYGEVGIGKTRLTRELGAYACLRGMQVLYGRCPALFRMDGVPPYVTWSEVIKDYLDTCTPEHLYKVIGFYPAEVAKLVPEVRQKLGAIPPSFPITPKQNQSRLFEAVSQFLTNISREAPLLVVLDDLQWTDPSSLLLLHYLARGVYRSPLLLLGAYRNTDVDSRHPLTSILMELNRERLPQSVRLKRLTLDGVSEMIKYILEQEDAPSEFCKLVYEKTGGNPFFVEEVVKSLKEGEVIYSDSEENRWKFKEVSKIEFPETVKAVIKTRIDRLDHECQNVLTLASFVGNDFTLEAMGMVTGIEESRLLESMDKTLKTGLIKESVIRGEGVCSFADKQVRDVVYEEVSPLRRKKFHALVGNALEKVYSNKINEHLGELAYHFLESGDKDKALGYFLRAGKKAAIVYANSEAASYFQSALKLLEDKEGELQEKGLVLERLGDIEELVGEQDACMKHWTEGLLLWERMNEKRKVSRLHRKMANVLWHEIGDTEKAKEHHVKALKILEAEPESAELAGLYEDIAHMCYRTENMIKALSWAEKALELAERLNVLEITASSSATLGTIFSCTGKGKAVESLERALRIALGRGYTETALRSQYNLAVMLAADENERRLKCFEEGFELAKKAGAVFWISRLGIGLAWTYIGMGRLDEAILLAEESVALDRKAGNLNQLCASMNALGFAYHLLGEWNKGKQCSEEALSISQKRNYSFLIAGSHAALGWFCIEKEEYAEAKEHFEKAIEVFEKLGATTYQMNYSQYNIWTYVELGELSKAKNLIDRMHEYAFQAEDKRLIALADALRAMLFRAQKNWDESLRYFEKSLQEYEAQDARRWNVYWFAKMVLYQYARAYLERDQEGDRKKAHDLLCQALEIFQKAGAKKDIEKTEARILEIEGRQVNLEPEPNGHIPTGYVDLDKLLCGGLPPNHAVVLTSPTCDKRNLLVKSFLETGAAKGEVTLYVTINPGDAKSLAREYQSSFHLFLCNPQEEAIDRSLPNVSKLRGVENLTDISIALTSAIRKLDPSLKGPRRICIDLISDVLLQHHTIQTRRWLTSLITELKSTGFTALAVIDPQMHSSEELHAILGLFDGEISIYERETVKGLRKFMKIRRMNTQKYLENDLRLKKVEL
jgi:predicted ATPase/KaiC/GvpD/RAD55 family RecA-like ATPase